jgi:glycosyltransferase involved in cell wall biosynthesis
MTVRVVIVHPADLAAPRPSGIRSFLRTFIRLAPTDFQLDHVGIAADPSVPLNTWREADVDGRAIRAMSLIHHDESARRARVPLSLMFSVALWRVRARLALDQAAIVQFHRPGTSLPLLSQECAKLSVLHLTSGDLVSPSSESRWRRLGPLLRAVEQFSLRRMDRIFVVNPIAAATYRARYPALAARIGYLPNWYDHQVFRPPTTGERAAARSELAGLLDAQLPARILLFAGRLDRQKRPDILLDALERLDREDVHVALVGEGALRPLVAGRLARWTARTHVRLLGYRDSQDLARLMRGADALVISSGHETGPTVALEALASGLPVIGTRVGRLPELVAETGAGALAADMSAAALCQAIAEVVDQPPDAYRVAAESAAADYSAARVLDPFFNLHRDLAGRASGAAHRTPGQGRANRRD